jgi:hypothetical protein
VAQYDTKLLFSKTDHDGDAPAPETQIVLLPSELVIVSTIVAPLKLYICKLVNQYLLLYIYVYKKVI